MSIDSILIILKILLSYYLIIALILILLIITKALNSKSKILEFELNIGIRCFKLSFKTNEKSTPSDQE